MASKTGRMAPPGYPTAVGVSGYACRTNRMYKQICFTFCRSIISWKISPPFIPTKVWSISGCLRAGCWELLSSLLKAGEGVSLGCAAAAVLCPRFVVSVLGVVACVVAVKGDRAARVEDVEKRRRVWTALRAALCWRAWSIIVVVVMPCVVCRVW